MALKPPKTYPEQVEILKKRGLRIPDEKAAADFLAHHNYYRLSPYRFPFTLPHDRDTFISGVEFCQLTELYEFDGRLRELMFDGTRQLEISVRARWAYVLAHAHGPLAYEMPKLFKNRKWHREALDLIDESVRESSEDFVVHHRTKYGGRPPIWVACEVMTLGSLSKMYDNMIESAEKKTVARTYDFNTSLFASLLRHASYIRNVCAHHARLWNKVFTVTPELPYSKPSSVVPNLNPASPGRLYNTLILLGHVVQIVDPASTWAQRVRGHVVSAAPERLRDMGFPANWQKLPFWAATK